MIPSTPISHSVSFDTNKNHKLCNLYTCKVNIGNLTFPSAEHAFQCLQRIQGNYEDWCIGGKFASWEYVLGVMREHNKMNSPGKELIGKLAEIVVNHPKTFGIKLKPMNEDMAISRERWFPIFKAKFQGELKDILLNTSGTLVQHDTSARTRVWRWGGLVQGNVLYGENIMGNLLTSFRDCIRRKRSAEVLEVGHTTIEQAVDAKFKKARTEGTIVDLSDEPDAPLLGKVENAVVTFAGSIESDHTGKTHGTKRRGLTKEDLTNIGALFPGKAVIYNIPGGPDANVLIVRGWCRDHMTCFKEITSIPDAYIDKHMWMYGKCREKKSRVNSNYADIQQEGHMDHPDPKQRVPSLLKFGPHLQRMRDTLTNIGKTTGVDTKNLFGEVNHYLKSKTIQGIGEHMDKERNMVIGLCLGTKDRNICFQAYQGAMPIGPKLKLCLHPGDLYLMDINAKGTGSIMKPHVKHHATGGTGSEKYLRGVTMNRRRKLLKKEGLNAFAQAIVDGTEIFTNGNPTYF